MKKIIFCLLMVLMLIGCQAEEALDYDAFDHIDHWDDIQALDDGIIIIYFYSKSCPVCIAISEDVFTYADQARENHTIYFIETSRIHEQGEPGFALPSTPALIILEDRELIEVKRGPIETVDYLQSLSS